MFGQPIPLRSNAFSSAARTPASGAAISDSNSVRVTRDRRPVSGQFGDDFGHRLRRQPFLGRAAFLPQPGERPHRGGAGRIDPTRRRRCRRRCGRATPDRSDRPRSRCNGWSRRSARMPPPASASVMLVPPPPKSSSATTPCGTPARDWPATRSVRRRHRTPVARACRWAPGSDRRAVRCAGRAASPCPSRRARRWRFQTTAARPPRATMAASASTNSRSA